MSSGLLLACTTVREKLSRLGLEFNMLPNLFPATLIDRIDLNMSSKYLFTTVMDSRNVPIDKSQIWLALAIGFASWLVLRAIYRLYFHPLAHIPGPRLTAITHLYEFYYDVLCDGKFTFQMEKMHEKYGPIIRVTPHEVHINDPDFFQEIYAPTNRKRNKYPRAVGSFGLPEGMVATVDHDLHRFRRGLVNEFFSRRSAISIAPIMKERVGKLMERFEEFYHAKKPVNICDVFAALTSDIITCYCYGKSWDFLDSKDFRSDIHKAGEDFTRFSHINRFFPFIFSLMRFLPLKVMAVLMPGKSAIFDFQGLIFQHFSMFTNKLETEQAQQSANIKGLEISRTGDDSIFTKLMHPSVPAQERTISRIQDEGFTFLVAGSETTGRVLSFAIYHLTRDTSMRDKLRKELRTVMPTPTSTASWSELERLPYLTALINETLRTAHASIMRFPRVAPNEALQYKDYVIPPWTPVSTSLYFVHMNPTIFPEPTKFNPERWIQAAEKGEPLTRYLVAFSRGSRSCLGINVAHMEIYTVIAHIVRRFDFELFETTPEDVHMTREWVLGVPESGSLKIRAKVTNILEE